MDATDIVAALDRATAALNRMGTPGALEQIGWAAQGLLVLIALAAAGFTYTQILALGRDSQERTRLARADFLLRLDNVFEGAEMTVARLAFERLRAEVRQAVLLEMPGVAPDAPAFQARLAEMGAERLELLRQSHLVAYRRAMKVCGFYETLGLFLANEQVEISDVDRLLGGAIIAVYGFVHVHVARRREEPPVHADLFQNFERMAERIARRRGIALPWRP
jgi:hypothetical protein